jgi:4a-hydroxytetrahydrobiopterin dehydratase
MPRLADEQIRSFTDENPKWMWSDDEITRSYEFVDFNQAMGFVTRVALAAEKSNHHPDIDIRWNEVTLTLSTHSEGGLTEKDLEMAKANTARSSTERDSDCRVNKT